MTRATLRRQPRTVLWAVAVSMTCVFASRLLADPRTSLGGPVLHFVVLCASGALSAASIALLVARRHE